MSGLLPEQKPWRWPRAAYLHVPFCAHHCGYCDFAVVTGKVHQVDAYLDALEAELSSLVDRWPVTTSFIGGGTPTFLNPVQLSRLTGLIQHWLPTQEEFTIEATPESISPDKVHILADAGVNRVSLGAQSFRNVGLEILERRHRADQVQQAVDLLRPRIDQVSIDLIFGVPGQTLDDWRSDLRQAIALSPNHLSCYGLTYEHGTPFWKRCERGQLIPIVDELERAMFLVADEMLSAAGYEHYEISNYAKPGCESKHNHVYWANHAYFGFGLGAAEYVNGVRSVNTRDFERYLASRERKRPELSPADAETSGRLRSRLAVQSSEQLDDHDRAIETISLNLRRTIGIVRGPFAEQTGFDLDEIVGPAIKRLVEQQLLSDDGLSVSLTRDGRCVADSVIVEFMREAGRSRNGRT